MTPQQRALRTLALLALSAAICATLLAINPAAAREREATLGGDNGKAATRTVSGGKGSVSSSTTSASGATLGARQVQRSASAAEGRITGPRGQAVTRSTTRTETGSTTTVTGPQGQSGSMQTTR